jgi:hypothetical protein
VVAPRDHLPRAIVAPESTRESKAKPQAFDRRLALDFDQSGCVKYAGKPVYRLATRKQADTSKLVAAVEAMARITADDTNAGNPTHIFVRADRTTEAYLIHKVLLICAEATSGIDGFALVTIQPRQKLPEPLILVSFPEARAFGEPTVELLRRRGRRDRHEQLGGHPRSEAVDTDRKRRAHRDPVCRMGNPAQMRSMTCRAERRRKSPMLCRARTDRVRVRTCPRATRAAARR